MADAVIHSAPPPPKATDDPRTRHLIAALQRGKSLPRRLSTSAPAASMATAPAQGDRDAAAGAHSRRGRARRVDAERSCAASAREADCAASASCAHPASMPPTACRWSACAGLPLMLRAEDSHTNHIHADDLGRACVAALCAGRANRAYNVSDDSALGDGRMVRPAGRLPLRCRARRGCRARRRGAYCRRCSGRS